ncbi:Hexosyltransferase [Fasciolopsis buskii]|uniref:Hexosyltransferase n=1 Tax=Fasciolopsis buskii TaxID=27845 RepID=A0A8E0VCH6_9TREM|nr:Hexosyltransferase [Fasciolopsis buski]
MGRIQSHLTTGLLVRTLLGLLFVFFILQLYPRIKFLHVKTVAIDPVREIHHIFLRLTPNGTSSAPGLMLDKDGRELPPPDFSSTVLPRVMSDTHIKVEPLISTGSEDLNFPLHLDFPELVRKILANETVPVKPINRPGFPILVPLPEKCQPSSLVFNSHPDLLILIKSAPSHFALRDAIRIGWGDERCWGGRQVVRLFLSGTVSPNESNTAARLKREMEVFGDIIQQDFIDHYYNNTYKIMFGLEWAVQYCSNAPLIMFVDDDFFVYPKNVIAYVEGLSAGVLDRLVSGYVWSNATPIRVNRSFSGKWFMSKAEFPDSRYPPYVAAGNFFVSQQMARELYVASQYTRYMRFDDVFLGIILKKMVRIPIHLKQIYAFTTINQNSTAFRTIISSHRFHDPALQLKAWDYLNCTQFCIKM